MSAKTIKNKIFNSIPTPLADAVSSSLIDKLNLVTRDEFNAQCKVLDRVEQKLNVLEDMLDKELQIYNQRSNSPDN